jgi:hypothetical protein
MKAPPSEKSAKLPPSLHKTLKTYASSQGRKMGEVLVEAVQDYLRKKGIKYD